MVRDETVEDETDGGRNDQIPLRRNSIAAGPKPTLDAEAIYGLIRKRAEYGNLRN